MKTLKKLKIIAIGGGEIGRPGTKIETEAIDKEIVKKIYNTDIIYVGGGNTFRMLKIWNNNKFI